MMVKSYFIKKPLLRSSLLQLQTISVENEECKTWRVHYRQCSKNSSFVSYEKVLHDPMMYKEASKCLYDLIIKVVDIIKKLAKEGICHNDARLANICFDDNYVPKFIDLDFSKKMPASDKRIENSIKHDLRTFALDLLDNLKDSFKKTKFFSALCDGEYNEQLVPSVGATVKTVIEQRCH